MILEKLFHLFTASFLTISFENKEETLHLIQETCEDFVASNMQLPVLSSETLDGIVSPVVHIDLLVYNQ